MNRRETRFVSRLNKLNKRAERNIENSLRDFIYNTLKISEYKFAQQVGVYPSTILRISTREKKPSEQTLARIIKCTSIHYPQHLESLRNVLKQYID